jgi:hypothetical protein
LSGATPISLQVAGSNANCSTTMTAKSWVDVALLEALAAAKMESRRQGARSRAGPCLGQADARPYASHDLVEGLVRLPAEPAPLTEAELARLDELDASYDEHAAILEDEDSAEEAIAAAEARSKRSSANARTFGPARRCWRPNSRPKPA